MSALQLAQGIMLFFMLIGVVALIFVKSHFDDVYAETEERVNNYTEQE
jgi:hypothetical protein